MAGSAFQGGEAGLVEGRKACRGSVVFCPLFARARAGATGADITPGPGMPRRHQRVPTRSLRPVLCSGGRRSSSLAVAGRAGIELARWEPGWHVVCPRRSFLCRIMYLRRMAGTGRSAGPSWRSVSKQKGTQYSQFHCHPHLSRHLSNNADGRRCLRHCPRPHCSG